MATLNTEVRPSLQQYGGKFRELDVLARLAASLPDSYELFHNIPLHVVDDAVDRYSELDVLVLGPSGNVLLVEVKAGPVVLRGGEMFKVYGAGERNIGQQRRFQHGAVVNRLREAGIKAQVSTCLVLPDYTIAHDQLLSVPRDRIIDASQFEQLGARVREILQTGPGCADRAILRRFLANELCVAPDLSVLGQQLQSATRLLANGLSTWVPRVQSDAGVIRVQATAGSGKTQLALTLIDNAVARGARVAYVCFNRALADHIRSLVPAQAEVANFHELALERFRRSGQEVDFGDATIFERMAATYLEHSSSFARQLDVLIVDEAQDFEPGWVEAVGRRLNSDGLLYLMEDEDQKLYQRDGFELDGAVTISCRDNYRTPRTICDVINALGLPSASIRSMSPYQGDIPGFRPYCAERGDVLAQTAAAVEELLTRGFGLADIVVVSCRGRARSAVLAAPRIGSHETARFSGDYDRNGEPVFTRGPLQVESVYRYKGQSARAVVLTEVDFDSLTAMDRRRLFVGMTRARMALEVVLSASAERCIAAVLGAAG